MRRFISLLMCTIIFVLSANVLAWEFNTDDDTKGWTPNARIADLKAGDGVLVATINSNMTDPFISCSREGPWDASDITGVLARMRWSADATTSPGTTFFWFNPTAKQIPYSAPEPNEWKVVLVDLIDQEDWAGTINQIRFDLGDGIPEERTVEIDWIRLESLYLTNETFEWSGLLGWDVLGDPNSFDDNEWENVNSLDYAVSWDRIPIVQTHSSSSLVKRLRKRLRQTCTFPP